MNTVVNEQITTTEAQTVEHALDTVLNPPSDRLGESLVVTNLLACLRLALEAVPTSVAIQECHQAIARLAAHRGFNAATVVPPRSLPVQRPAWRLMAHLTPRADPLVRFAAAVETALAWSKRRAFPPGQAKLLHSLSRKPCGITVSEFLARRAEALEWPSEIEWLARTDATLGQLIGSEQAASEQRPPEERASVQILFNAAFARFTQRAGVPDHRCLSPGHLSLVNQFISNEGTDREATDLRCALVLGALGGITADLLGHIALSRNRAGPRPSHWLDLQSGVLSVDLSIIAREASITGRHKATLVASRPLPQWVAVHLQTLLKSHATAQSLGDLLLVLREIKGTTPLSFMPKASHASWAQWIQSAPMLFDAAGVHRVHSALLSSNFSGVARSKTHYQRVPVGELWDAAEQAYAALGWGPVVDQPEQGLDFGVDAAPMWSDVVKVDTYLKDRTVKRLPGRRAPWLDVAQHHNAFIIWAAFRLMTSLGLREARELDLPLRPFASGLVSANMRDKLTGERSHYLPVLLPSTAHQTVRMLRIHARHLSIRGGALGAPPLVVDWAKRVEAGEASYPLCLIGTGGRLVRMGTRHVMEVIPPELSIAPDCGRKLLENLLRQAGLDNQLIDLVLRHEVQGHEVYATASDLQVDVAVERARRAIDEALKPLMLNRFRGLTSSTMGVSE